MICFHHRYIFSTVSLQFGTLVWNGLLVWCVINNMLPMFLPSGFRGRNNTLPALKVNTFMVTNLFYFSLSSYCQDYLSVHKCDNSVKMKINHISLIHQHHVLAAGGFKSLLPFSHQRGSRAGSELEPDKHRCFLFTPQRSRLFFQKTGSYQARKRLSV